MAEDSAKPDLISAIDGLLQGAEQYKEKRILATEYTHLAVLANLTHCLHDVSAAHDAALSLRIERLCINFERGNAAAANKNIALLNKQLSEIGSAQNSLALVQNTAAYRRHVQEFFPNGLSELPQGDAYIIHALRQIKRLGHAQKNAATPHEKTFFAARQVNLRAGIAAFKKLQKQALFPDKK